MKEIQKLKLYSDLSLFFYIFKSLWSNFNHTMKTDILSSNFEGVRFLSSLLGEFRKENKNGTGA